MNEMCIGVISDTHGLLRRRARRALSGCDLIIHAGDVGSPDILHELEHIAPVHAVRGNTDFDPWADELPLSTVVEAGSALIYVLHDLMKLDLNPAAVGLRAVISGHTHFPLIESRKGVLFLNPGSAGPRRRGHPVSLATLQMRSTGLEARIIELESA